jgi:hypothetical protein
MKKRDLHDLIDDLTMRVGMLEGHNTRSDEKRDGEIALLKTAHEVSTFWRLRCEGMEKERDEYRERAKKLDEQLTRVAAVREAKPETSWEIARREARARFSAEAQKEAELAAARATMGEHSAKVYSAFRKENMTPLERKPAKKRAAKKRRR